MLLVGMFAISPSTREETRRMFSPINQGSKRACISILIARSADVSDFCLRPQLVTEEINLTFSTIRVILKSQLHIFHRGLCKVNIHIFLTLTITHFTATRRYITFVPLNPSLNLHFLSLRICSGNNALVFFCLLHLLINQIEILFRFFECFHTLAALAHSKTG